MCVCELSLSPSPIPLLERIQPTRHIFTQLRVSSGHREFSGAPQNCRKVNFPITQVTHPKKQLECYRLVRRCDGDVDGTSCCTAPYGRRLEAHLLTVAQDDGRMRQCIQKGWPGGICQICVCAVAVLTAAPTFEIGALDMVGAA